MHMEGPAITPSFTENLPSPEQSTLGVDIREHEIHIGIPVKPHRVWNRFVLGVAGAIILGAVMATLFFLWQRSNVKQQIHRVQVHSYDECLSSPGSVLTTTTPLKCTTQDGLVFNEPSVLQLQNMTDQTSSSNSGSVTASPLPAVSPSSNAGGTSPLSQMLTNPTKDWQEESDPLDHFAFRYPSQQISISEPNDVTSELAPLQSSFNGMFHYSAPTVLRHITLRDQQSIDKINQINQQDPTNGYLQYTDVNRFRYVVEAMQIFILDNSSQLSPQDWYNKYSNYPAVFQNGSTDQREATRPSIPLDIQGVPAFYTTTAETPAGYTKVVLIPRGSKMFLIFIQGNPVAGSIGDQIFSTFHFLTP